MNVNAAASSFDRYADSHADQREVREQRLNDLHEVLRAERDAQPSSRPAGPSAAGGAA